MNARNAVILVIDRLGAGFVGPYGNTWLETPAFNRLAAEGLTFEFPITDTPSLATVYRSYCRGWHALTSSPCVEAPSCLELVRRAGGQTVLFTDEPAVTDLGGSLGFSEVIAVPEGAKDTAPDVADTQLGRLFSMVLDHLPRLRSPYVLWIHAQAMSAPWDAPYELRCSLRDEDDPPPPNFVAPPSGTLPPDADPDLALGYQQAYAAQISVADTCLALLWEQLRQRADWASTLFACTSPRGYPLGEHGMLGDTPGPLYGELCHVPCLIRAPGQELEAARSQRFAQPADLAATLASWLGLADSFAERWGGDLLSGLDAPLNHHRQAAICAAGSRRMLRTPAWMLLADQDQQELYSKPDDRWEVNEVSSRCRVELALMRELLEQYEAAARGGDRRALRALPRELVSY